MDLSLKIILKAVENGDFNGEKYLWLIMDGVLYKSRVVSNALYQEIQNERHPESIGDIIAQTQQLKEIILNTTDSIKGDKEKFEISKDWITLLDTTMFNGINEIHFEKLRMDVSKISAWYEVDD